METKQKKQMDLLTAIEQIVEKARGVNDNAKVYQQIIQ